MIPSIIRIILISVLALAPISCATPGIRMPDMIVNVASDFISTPQASLPVGEELRYTVRWMGMPVGEVIIRVDAAIPMEGRMAYPIVATIRTTRILDKIYRVEDLFVSYIDTEGLYCVRSEKHQREGGYTADEIITYDHEKGRGFYRSLTNNSIKEFEIYPYGYDPLSAIFYFRQQEIAIGEPVIIPINSDEKKWDAKILVHGAETIEMHKKGSWNALVVEPTAWHDGKALRKGSALIWLSADERRIPLLLQAKVPLAGRISVSLKSHRYSD